MFRSRLLTGLSAVALVASGVAFSAPASAIPYQVTIVKQRTGATPIVAGANGGTEFTITVTNTYTEPVEVPLSDVPGAGLVVTGVTSATWSNCTVEDYLVSCPPAELQPNQPATLVVSAKAEWWVRPSSLVNCAYATNSLRAAGECRSGPRWRQSMCPGCARGGDVQRRVVREAFVDVINDADLELTASHAAAYDQVDPGAQAVVDFAVKNNGPSGASGPITVKGSLPTGTSFVTGSGDGWTCSAVGQDVECSLTPQPPAAPQPAFVFLPVVPPGEELAKLSWTLGTVRPGTVASYPISATVASDTDDSKPANNTSTTPIGVTPVDLALAKSAPSAVNVGDKAVWNLGVSNVGTIDDAAKITVVDTLPTGSTFVSGTGDGWTCSAAGQKVTCTRDGLVKGVASTVLITAKVKSGAPRVTNQATVSTLSYESNTANNSASADLRVRRIEQTAKALPASPARVKSGKTDQGKRLTTRVLCRPVKAGALGEVAYCKVTRKGDVVKVTVLGSRKVKVTVIQTAKGGDKYKPFVQRRTYIVKP